MHDIEFYWREATAFHGNACPGLAIGCRIAVDAMTLLNVEERVKGDEVMCIAETDACSLDGIQSVLGCTVGKGNLFLKQRGKQAFTFFRKGEEEGVRFCWTAPNALPREQTELEKIEWFLRAPAKNLYVSKVIPVSMPTEARTDANLVCTGCSERTSETMVRMVEGVPYCLDCFEDLARSRK